MENPGFLRWYIGLVSNMTIMKNQKQGWSSFKGYSKYCSLTKEEIEEFYDTVFVHHFQLQVAIMEITDMIVWVQTMNGCL